MTLSTVPEVSVRSVEPLDFGNRDHRALLFDLAWNDREHLLNDHVNDVILIISEYERQQAAGTLFAFVTLIDGALAGCTWLETDRYGIGRVHGALLPEYKTAWNGCWFMRQLVEFAFETLGLRVLDSEFKMYSKHDKQSAAYERILKRIGFQKRAILPDRLMVNGQPHKTILLDFLKRDYDVKTEK
jgi:RimJ/RimL family protein N-acetyltransferase